MNSPLHPNDTRPATDDKSKPKAPLPKTRRLNKYSVILLLVIFGILPIVFSRYLQVSSPQHERSLKNADISQGIGSNTSSNNSKDQIRKPTYDQNQSRYTILPNGLKVFMISDLTAQMSSAALALDVGTFSDPPEIPGVAHLLEHVLIIGSKTYSKEIYEKQVHNGEASIGFSDTVYSCDAKPANFEETLDIFADPFINPRFDFEWYEPELLRIDLEFNETFVRKDRRLFGILQYMADPESLLARDMTGNYETLYHTPIKKGINVSQALYDLFEKHYSSNRMLLVVKHNKPLDEIQKIVANSAFLKIPNRNLSKPSLDHFPKFLLEKNRNKILEYSATSRKNDYGFRTEGSMVFQICGVQSKTDAINFISYIMKRNHVGSLMREIPRTNLASALQVFYLEVSSEYGIFQIDFDLTLSGRDHFKDLLVKAVFGYIHKLIHTGLTEALYQEYLNEKSYLFQNSAPIKSSKQLAELARDLLTYSPEDILSRYGRSDGVHQILAQAKSILQQMNTHNLLLLQSFDSRYFYISNLIDNLSQEGQGFEKLETLKPVTRIEYRVESIPQDLIQEWNTTSGESYPTFKFSQQNPFVPKNLDLIKESPQHQVIKLSRNIWYGTASDLKTPKVALYLEFPSLKSIENLFFLRLLQSSLSFKGQRMDGLIKEQIQDAGQSVDLQDQSIKIQAYSDSLPLILDVIPQIETNFSLPINQTKHSLYKSKLEEIFFEIFPDQEAVHLLSDIVENHRCTSLQEKKKNVWESFLNFSQNPDKYKAVIDNLYANPEFFVYGNILPKDAITIARKLAIKAPKTTASISLRSPLNISGHNLIYRSNFLWLQDKQAVVLNYYQGGVANAKNIAYMKILVSVLDKYVNGYGLLMNQNILVSIESFIRGDTIGLFVLGYSFRNPRFDQNVLDMLFENITTNFSSKAKERPREEIEKMVREISASILRSRKLDSFEKRADALFGSIRTQGENYDYFHRTTAEEFLEYVDDFFSNCGKISLQGFSKNQNFTNHTVLEAKYQLTMKKQPTLVNSTESLRALFASPSEPASNLQEIIGFVYRIYEFFTLWINHF